MLIIFEKVFYKYITRQNKKKRNSNAIITFYNEKRNRLFVQRSFKFVRNILTYSKISYEIVNARTLIF